MHRKSSGLSALFCRSGLEIMLEHAELIGGSLAMLCGNAVTSYGDLAAAADSSHGRVMSHVRVMRAMLCCVGCVLASGCKLSLGDRGSIEATVVKCVKAMVKASQNLTDNTALQALSDLLLPQARADHEEDITLACGGALCAALLLYAKAGIEGKANQQGIFAAGWQIYQRVQMPVTAAHLGEISTVPDICCIRKTMPLMLARLSIRLPDRSLLSEPWWHDMCQEAVVLAKIYAELLSDRLSFMFFQMAFIVLERASSIESQQSMLVQSGVVDALEHCCVHGLTFTQASLPAYAAGAVVALVGRNDEGGKTLNKSTVRCCLVDCFTMFEKGHIRCLHNDHVDLKTVQLLVDRVATMSVSDANKLLMLQYEGLVGMLVSAKPAGFALCACACACVSPLLPNYTQHSTHTQSKDRSFQFPVITPQPVCKQLQGLLLDHERRDEEGADALQQGFLQVLLRLSLFGPSAELLKSHSPALDGLRSVVAESGSGKEMANQALFQLEGRDRAGRASRNSSAGDAQPGVGTNSASLQHVMMSYCWDQQAVIKRVHAALVKRGYTAWIDIEQMTGSTVDSMAAAVESAEVMLIGVSRQYKESTNCRLEAQYAMQREVPTIPLMLVEKYQADGWLGMLIGTQLWYGFFGSVLSEIGLFDGKVSELCRDLGERGKAGALVAMALTLAEPSTAGFHGGSGGDNTQLRCELAALKLRPLEWLSRTLMRRLTALISSS